MSWREVMLGDVVNFIGGAQPPKTDFIYEEREEYIRLIQTRDYKSDKNLTYIPIEKSRRFCTKNDVMIGRYGPPVFQILRGLEGSYNVALMKAEPSKQVDREYLYYFLKQDKLFKLIDGLSQRSSGQTGIDMDALKAYPMLLPPLAEQKRIASILDKADAIRRKRQQAIQLADEFLRSVFLDMFGDPKINHKRWKITKLGDYIEFLGDIGSNGSNANVARNLVMSDSEDYAVMIRTVNLNANNFDNKVKYISKETYEYFSKSKIYGGELIMNKIGSAGKFWIMPKLNRPVSLGLNQFVLRLENLNVNFLFYCLSTKFGQLDIASRTRGAVTKSITKSEVRDIPLIYPPIELQDEFEQIVKKIEVIKNKFQPNDNIFNDLFKSLSQKAFKGEL